MKKKRTRRRISKARKSSVSKKQRQFFQPSVQARAEPGKTEATHGTVHGEAAGGGSFFPAYMNDIGSKGKALPGAQRQFFEGRLQHDFGDVRVHTGPEASRAASDIGAKAFTWKNHIILNKRYFSDGQTKDEIKLLAHELTHVRQQRNGISQVQMTPEDDQAPQEQARSPREQEAEQQEEVCLAPERVPEIQLTGKPVTLLAYANSVVLNGKTTAKFDGGRSRTKNLVRVASRACANAPQNDCYTYTGTLEIKYSVSTSVSLPAVPAGLKACQKIKVRNAIKTILSPHEQQHVRAFQKYNGTTKLPINYTGTKTGLHAYLQNLHDTDAAARQTRVQQASDALDPFHFEVDITCDDGNAKGAGK